MARIDRLPAIPLIASDPYTSVWIAGDDPVAQDTTHWCGPIKPVQVVLNVDGINCPIVGRARGAKAELKSLIVTPTSTFFVSEYAGVQIETRFTTPALPDDLDLLSMPVTLVSMKVAAVDGKTHKVGVRLYCSEMLCYDGQVAPNMISAAYKLGDVNVAWCGQKIQKPLCHTGDHITIDWGYLYIASDAPCEYNRGVQAKWEGELGAEAQTVKAIVAYDDIASINYFGDLCKAWYRRNGAQITDAITSCYASFDSIVARCDAWDERVLADAGKISPEYQELVSASWRQAISAHKLIATPKGEMALLSKENSSNGCIGTVDVSYPSVPLFLKYCPELVNALCRPVLEFASMPVWDQDYAPHDVGRYPYATGQVYAIRGFGTGETYPPYYLYPAGTGIYDHQWEMPVEECGNMLVMLETARAYGADKTLGEKYRGLLDQWVQYLVRFGEDPGEQLCTDDFAGHLAHNVNLAAKAIVGVACYGRLIGDPAWEQKAKDMAGRLMEKIGCEGNTPLTLEGNGWSMKYNLMWDKVLGLGLLPDEFYAKETASYVPRMNTYGLPLDSRADYTKSDWICWAATMADDPEVRAALLAPIAKYLRESSTRVPFSDWYDTKHGRFVSFIARSVQGGVFAPMLRL